MHIKSHFKFNKQEQNGIFFLLVFIVLIECAAMFIDYGTLNHENTLQIDAAVQAQINALKETVAKEDSITIFPFNPNFMSDFKAYTLGMSLEEMDRLSKFRKSGKFINSAHEFQAVTKVSDSLLLKMAPYFKFPNWVRQKERVTNKHSSKNQLQASANVAQQDLNSATAADLQQIYGIGDKLSARIIKFRDRLGGFLIDAQLYDTYGLEKTVADRVLGHYTVIHPPKIQKIDVNTATVHELSQLIYLQKHVAQGIIDYRNDKGRIKSFDDLKSIRDFPFDKIDRIKLYLTLKKVE